MRKLEAERAAGDPDSAPLPTPPASTGPEEETTGEPQA